MASLHSESRIDFRVVLSLNESESRALLALTAYGTQSFLDVFYKEHGKSCLQPHEGGLRSLFNDIAIILPTELKKLDNSRKAFRDDL